MSLNKQSPIVFCSIEQFREHYFPETVAKERRDKEIEEKGWGVVAARELVAKIYKKLGIQEATDAE